MTSIRLATSNDIPKITKLKGIEDEQRYSQRIHESQTGNSAYLLAEENGEILGQVFLKYYGTPDYPTYPNMEDLIVAENHRGHGLGTALINECERLSKEKGFKMIGLSVNPTLNTQAKSLYEKLGYKSVGNEPYLSGIYNGTEDWVIDLVKQL